GPCAFLYPMNRTRTVPIQPTESPVSQFLICGTPSHLSPASRLTERVCFTRGTPHLIPRGHASPSRPGNGSQLVLLHGGLLCVGGLRCTASPGSRPAYPRGVPTAMV